jgi:hypothetical protein
LSSILIIFVRYSNRFIVSLSFAIDYDKVFLANLPLLLCLPAGILSLRLFPDNKINLPDPYADAGSKA